MALMHDLSFGVVASDSAAINASAQNLASSQLSAVELTTTTSSVAYPQLCIFSADIRSIWAGTVTEINALLGRDKQFVDATVADIVDAWQMKLPCGIKNVVLHLRTQFPRGIFALTPIVQYFDDVAGQWADVPGSLMANSGVSNAAGNSIFVGYELIAPFPRMTDFRVRLHAAAAAGVSVENGDAYFVNAYVNFPSL